MISLLLVSGLARASDAGELSVWSTSAVEAVPFLGGQVAVRAAEHLASRAALEGGGEFVTDVSFRLPPDKTLAAGVQLHQLALSRRLSWGELRLGRQLRLDSRGWLPLDGASLDVHASEFFKPTVYAGRLWSPEPGETMVSTWVGGVSLTMRPPDGEGEASRALVFHAGWMERLAAGALSHSLTAGAAFRTPRGGSATADAELRLGEQAGSRAGLRATAFLGSHLSLSPELRWEDLSPDAEVSGLRTPMDWLGGEGYGAASLAARVGLGDIEITASGGPVLHMDETGLGGLGRGGLGWEHDALQLGAFGSGAAVAGSWVAGGGLEGAYRAERLSVRAEAGLFRFQPLSGADATLGEARARLSAPLASADDGALTLALDGAIGADRLLQPWARAALVLEGHLGPGATP